MCLLGISCQGKKNLSRLDGPQAKLPPTLLGPRQSTPRRSSDPAPRPAAAPPAGPGCCSACSSPPPRWPWSAGGSPRRTVPPAACPSAGPQGPAGGGGSGSANVGHSCFAMRETRRAGATQDQASRHPLGPWTDPIRGRGRFAATAPDYPWPSHLLH